MSWEPAWFVTCNTILGNKIFECIVETIFASFFDYNFISQQLKLNCLSPHLRVCYLLLLVIVSFVSCLPLISFLLSRIPGVFYVPFCTFLVCFSLLPFSFQKLISILPIFSFLRLYFLNHIPSFPLLCLSSIFHSDNHVYSCPCSLNNTTE